MPRNDTTDKLNTPIAFIAPLLSFSFLWAPISNSKACGIHTSISPGPRTGDMAVGKGGSLGMDVTVELLAGGRYEGIRRET